MHRMLRWYLGLFLSFAACAAGPTADPAVETLTLVHLRTGPQPPTKAEAPKVFQGHFANMERLAEARQLLVAGPYGTQKSAPDLRGVFVLATADRRTAEQLAGSDPAVQAGVFVLEYHTLRTQAPLRAFLEAELAKTAAQRAAGKTPPPGEGIRGYVLLTAAVGGPVREALAGRPGVLLLAEHDDGGAFAVLEAKDLAAAEALLQPVRSALGEVRLDEWYAAGGLADLPKLGR